jgi:Small metal-binding protein
MSAGKTKGLLYLDTLQKKLREIGHRTAQRQGGLLAAGAERPSNGDAEAGEKAKANPHTEEAIKHLGQAIDEGKKGHADAATTYAEACSPSHGDYGFPRACLRVNGVRHDLRLDPRTTLLDALREHLHLAGTKKGPTSSRSTPERQ